MTSQLFPAQQGAYPLDAPEDRAVTYARCKRETDGCYTRSYRGSQRTPRWPDERGATCVIDLSGGSRFVLYAIENNTAQMRVEELPAPTLDVRHAEKAVRR